MDFDEAYAIHEATAGGAPLPRAETCPECGAWKADTEPVCWDCRDACTCSCRSINEHGEPEHYIDCRVLSAPRRA